MGWEHVPADRLDARFGNHLRHHDAEHLEGLPWPAYGMWPDARLAYLNPAYAKRAPAGWGLGADVLAAAGPLRQSVARLHRAALSSGRPTAFRYACPTPWAARTFELLVVPLDGSRAPLALHSLVNEHAHRAVRPANEPLYRTVDGLVVQCAHCRRTRRGREAVWDVVPDFIARLPLRTTHGICPTCEAHYFRTSEEEGDSPR